MLDHIGLNVSDYDAYVLDLDGNNIEAVCHHPE
jgi:hypothetical protein